MAEQEQTPTLPPKTGKITVKLGKFLTHGDDELTELNLRQPTVEDVADIGYPFNIAVGDGETRIEMKPKIILKYASRLAAVPPSVLKDMALGDFMAVQTEIMGFFEGLVGTPPT